MRLSIQAGLTATLLLLLTGCAPKLNETPPTARLTTDWVNAYNANDATAIAALYEPESVLLTSYAPPVQGRQKIEEFWSADASSGTTTSVTVEHGEAQGNLATLSGTYGVKVGDKAIDGGRFVQVWKQQGDAWLIHRDVWIEDTATPPDDVKAQWLAAYNGGDASVLGALYTQDAEVVTTGSGPVRGRDAILSLWKADIADGPVDTEMKEEDRYVRGPVAFLSGLYTVKNRKNGKTAAEGHYSQLWVRNGNEDWKVHREIWVQQPAIGK